MSERGIDINFSRKAPQGKFRVVCVDTFDGSDWVSDDLDSLEEAVGYAKKLAEGKSMFMAHIYDDTGTHRGSAGKF